MFFDSIIIKLKTQRIACEKSGLENLRNMRSSSAIFFDNIGIQFKTQNSKDCMREIMFRNLEKYEVSGAIFVDNTTTWLSLRQIPRACARIRARTTMCDHKITRLAKENFSVINDRQIWKCPNLRRFCGWLPDQRVHKLPQFCHGFTRSLHSLRGIDANARACDLSTLWNCIADETCLKEFKSLGWNRHACGFVAQWVFE